MTKTIITIIVSVSLLFLCSYGEFKEINDTFDAFYTFLEQTEIKIKNGNVTVQDTVALKNFWLTKKKSLHIWIPHTDIKEVDLWLGETIAFTENGKLDEAATKIVVLKGLAKQIPETYSIRLENIF
mgnify:FL=1